MKKRYLLAFLGGVVVAIALALSLRAFAPIAAPAPTSLLVSAAASLQDVLEEIKPQFESAHPNIPLTYNFGASGALLQQIEQGAPADVFISAASKQMDVLESKDLLLPNTRQNLLGNRLVLVTPKDSTLNLNDFRQLAQSEVRRISVGEFRSVPAGTYASEVFTNLGILEALQPKFVFANNVRGVLAAVESGNVDAGIVYATDARASNGVTEVAVATTDLHSPIVYPMAVLKASANPEAAQTLTSFLNSPEVSEVFESYGFISLD